MNTGEILREQLSRLLGLAEEATTIDLALVALVLLIGLILAYIRIQGRIVRGRQAPALSIGGWGTRGKSGVERKKAALLHGLGYEVLSKTTGCEAMIIHSRPRLSPVEIFLYRPNDKATVREHAAVLDIARRLEPDVFLWECMALSPDKVELLEQEWMRERWATLANTYPDHEDIQGPAGIDIPRVMTEFVPRRGALITAEEQMLPLLAEACRKRGTELVAVSLEETGFFTPDILERFPYNPHPANLGLVGALAERLGVSRFVAFKEIADHIVPDLGAFKTYRGAAYLGRRLEFTNGMSANERRGFLANWERLPWHDRSIADAPGDFFVLLLNNRADRIARSRAFADILVLDAPSIDLVVGIGTNLTGLMGYIKAALRRRTAGIDVFEDLAADPSSPRRRFETIARNLRIPLDRAQLRNRLGAFWTAAGHGLPQQVLGALDRPEGPLPVIDEATPEELRPFARREIERYEEMDRLRREIERAAGADAAERRRVNDEVRRFVERIFLEKLSIIDDPGVSGNFIIDFIARRSPPGCQVRILGAQNIKGTGLDFMYRWVYHETMQQAWRELEQAREPAEALAALEKIERCPIGVLELALIQQALPGLRARDGAADPEVAAALNELRERAERFRREFREERRRAESGGPRRQGILRPLERFLEPGDGLRRRREAQRILEDLTLGLVSHRQAAARMKALVDRQKGGWLEKRLRRQSG
jgi:poly-gamma-glutamate synthase PgsB/CapB